MRIALVVAAILGLSLLFLGTDRLSGIWTLIDGGADATTGSTAVIPPGREDLIAEMLGREAPLPDGCRFAGGQIDYSVVEAAYACPGGEVVLELAHPSQAPPEAAKTERFAISLRSGPAPEGLAAAVASRVRSREAEFEWKWVGGPQSGFSPRTVALAAAAFLLALAGLGLVLRRRASARRSHAR